MYLQATIASGFSEFSLALAGYHCMRLFSKLLVRTQATGDEMMKFISPSPVSSQATIASGLLEFSPALAGYHCMRLFGKLLVRTQATGEFLKLFVQTPKK